MARKNTKFEVALKLILKDKKGKMLILKLPKTSSMASFYDLPGGRIQEGEIKTPFLKIIKREIKEELGPKFVYEINEMPVAISRQKRVSRIDNKIHFIFAIFFEAKFGKGEIILSSEHKNYIWAKINKNNYKNYFLAGMREGIAQYVTGKLQ